MSSSGVSLNKKDYKSDQDVRWCPGCGDYGILNSVQAAFADMGKDPAKTLIISGIGCSSRFPYYMNTYGFHTIHGRAPALATGAKLANPDLDVWVVTGDGDGLSIGGNHLIHALRRNVGVKVLLFNNRIYGLTKGQYSPTSEQGKMTKSTPLGSVDFPFKPIALALGARASFVARSIDIMGKHLEEMLKRADEHEGTAFIEIYQNCNIFNDGAYASFTEKAVRPNRILEVEHGKPLIFGAERNQALRFTENLEPQIVKVGEGGVDAGDLLPWDVHNPNSALAMALANLDEAQFPVPIGVLRSISRQAYETGVTSQIAIAQERKTETLDELLTGGETWEVK